MAKIEKPQSPVWKNAQRYRARFFDSRFPICGTHLVYVVEGRKWARISQGDLVSDNNRSALDRAVATMASNSSDN